MHYLSNELSTTEHKLQVVPPTLLPSRHAPLYRQHTVTHISHGRRQQVDHVLMDEADSADAIDLNDPVADADPAALCNRAALEGADLGGGRLDARGTIEPCTCDLVLITISTNVVRMRRLRCSSWHALVC